MRFNGRLLPRHDRALTAYPVVNEVTLSNGRLEVEVNARPSWEDFDWLMTFIQTKFNATVIANGAGLDQRVCVFQIEDQKINLFHDGWGINAISYETRGGEATVRRIAAALARELTEAAPNAAKPPSQSHS